MNTLLRHCGYALPGIRRQALIGATIFIGLIGAAAAAEVRVAVAANFTQAAKEIGTLFERATGHRAVFSFGSTGQLFTQITQEAPFDVFLAADSVRPAKALEDGYAVPGSLITYATGRLVLFSKYPDMVNGEATLREGKFTRLAIANPVTAPYGAAAIEVMTALGVYDGIANKIVQGNNVAQVYQFLESGNAEIGFVALAQVAGYSGGSRWVVPPDHHTVIAQDAVLLKRGSESEAARLFMTFLNGPEALAVKTRYGYGSGD